MSLNNRKTTVRVSKQSSDGSGRSQTVVYNNKVGSVLKQKFQENLSVIQEENDGNEKKSSFIQAKRIHVRQSESIKESQEQQDQEIIEGLETKVS